ncbi:hypothetical protein [Nostoc sp.]
MEALVLPLRNNDTFLLNRELNILRRNGFIGQELFNKSIGANLPST